MRAHGLNQFASEIAGTIPGATIRTGAAGQRIELDSDDGISFYANTPFGSALVGRIPIGMGFRVSASGLESKAHVIAAEGYAFYIGSTPVLSGQMGYTANADGTLADLTSKFNALLAKLRIVGLMASS